MSDQPYVLARFRKEEVIWPWDDFTQAIYLGKPAERQGPDAERQHRETPPRVKAIIEAEFGRVNINKLAQRATKETTAPKLIPGLMAKDPEHIPYEVLLQGLYHLSLRQRTIWQVFVTLVDSGLVNIEALRARVDLETVCPLFNRTGNISSMFAVELLLRSFDKLHDASVPFPDLSRWGRNSGVYAKAHWETDLTWLAAMIIRGGSNFMEIMWTIDRSGYLGQLDHSWALEWSHHMKHFLPAGRDPLKFYPSPNEQAPPKADLNNHNVLGLWLPHGISTDLPKGRGQIGACLERFERIELAAKEVFGAQNIDFNELDFTDFERLPGGYFSEN